MRRQQNEPRRSSPNLPLVRLAAWMIIVALPAGGGCVAGAGQAGSGTGGRAGAAGSTGSGGSTARGGNLGSGGVSRDFLGVDGRVGSEAGGTGQRHGALDPA